MTDPHDLDRQRRAYQAGARFFNENDQTLRWYSNRIVDLCRRSSARSVVSLGIGQRIVCRWLLDQLAKGFIQRYAIVEGSALAIAELASELPVPPGLSVHEAWFESFESDEQFDVVEMGFVLEHVDDPSQVLDRFRECLSPTGVIAVAVPNARSLHRRLGNLAGLLDDVFQLSPEDTAFGHQRYFDLESLRSLIRKSGFEIRREEGIFLKPFTMSQMASLGLSQEVHEALFKIAVDLPDISNAVYLEIARC